MFLTDPAVGFHFAVVFELFPQTPNDFRFQEVSGLTADIETEEIKEGGENRFTHKVPIRTKYSDLTLKRGVFVGSGIVEWCKKAIEEQDIRPTNVLISLLNDMHLPLHSWYVINAFPTQWAISEFKAQESAIVVESLKLNYNYFKTIRI